jgi:hypothetical protein
MAKRKPSAKTISERAGKLQTTCSETFGHDAGNKHIEKIGRSWFVYGATGNTCYENCLAKCDHCGWVGMFNREIIYVSGGRPKKMEWSRGQQTGRIMTCLPVWA